MSFLKYTTLLRRMGFRRDFKDRHCTQYTMELEDIRVDVQLWREGSHRVSHAIKATHGYRWVTRPTEFTSIKGMGMAIIHELTRDRRGISRETALREELRRK